MGYTKWPQTELFAVGEGLLLGFAGTQEICSLASPWLPCALPTAALNKLYSRCFVQLLIKSWAEAAVCLLPRVPGLCL